MSIVIKPGRADLKSPQIHPLELKGQLQTSGFKKGTKFTFPNEGDEGSGIIPADVIFTLAEKAHEHFERDGKRLRPHVEIRGN